MGESHNNEIDQVTFLKQSYAVHPLRIGLINDHKQNKTIQIKNFPINCSLYI